MGKPETDVDRIRIKGKIKGKKCLRPTPSGPTIGRGGDIYHYHCLHHPAVMGITLWVPTALGSWMETPVLSRHWRAPSSIRVGFGLII